MSTTAWIITIVDTDLVTPPIKYMQMGTNFDVLAEAALDYLERKIFPVLIHSEPLNESEEKGEKELDAFSSQIGKLRDEGGYLMSIGGTICLDVRLMQATMALKSKRRGVELSDVAEKETPKRSRKSK